MIDPMVCPASTGSPAFYYQPGVKVAGPQYTIYIAVRFAHMYAYYQALFQGCANMATSVPRGGGAVKMVSFTHRGREVCITYGWAKLLSGAVYRSRAHIAALAGISAIVALRCGSRGQLRAAATMAVVGAFFAFLTRCGRATTVHSGAVERLVSAVAGVDATVCADRDDNAAEGARTAVTRVVREWLNKAILRFGRMEDTPADRRVLRLWLGDEMKKADMRDKDAVAIIPTVVEFMFVPGMEELQADEIRCSMMKQGLIRAVTADPW
ncbi:hypothetical protein 1 [Changjiang tombus-like virus 6]|uniref:hypothetical protein 1 n=1 Tax=Changjiang tombus-like virus 6 TaxID=1922820 RepID=UPI00090AD5C4|nr:hypothetical protein 1 [Changjiang tombus-like virus 6]APG76261.1 hypothetical protein 1 [Changjiang tombus-like virus 6]